MQVAFSLELPIPPPASGDWHQFPVLQVVLCSPTRLHLEATPDVNPLVCECILSVFGNGLWLHGFRRGVCISWRCRAFAVLIETLHNQGSSSSNFGKLAEFAVTRRSQVVSVRDSSTQHWVTLKNILKLRKHSGLALFPGWVDVKTSRCHPFVFLS